MILIKLGGSVITDKSEYRSFKEDVVSRLCREIKESGEEVMIVHGAGSFGHILAKEHMINGGFVDERQIPAVTRISYDVRDLNLLVVDELNRNKVPAVSIPTGSAFFMIDRRLIIDPTVIMGYVTMGMVPVLFGDVVLDRTLGFAICSGDQIMERLTEIFDFSRIVFVSDVDGLYDSDPKKNKEAKLIESVTQENIDSVNTESDAADVTGGVKEKMKTMLRMCSEDRDCVLVNGTVEGRLLSLLKGEKVVCTRAAVESEADEPKADKTDISESKADEPEANVAETGESKTAESEAGKTEDNGTEPNGSEAGKTETGETE